MLVKSSALVAAKLISQTSADRAIIYGADSICAIPATRQVNPPRAALNQLARVIIRESYVARVDVDSLYFIRAQPPDLILR